MTTTTTQAVTVEKAGTAEPRERWSSQAAFVLAAIGSAVGLGNFWRFPATAAANGGGQFFVPYLLSLLIIGAPLLLLELCVGQRKQANVFDAFAAMSKSLKGVGLAAALNGSLLSVYYMAVIAWSLVYLVYAFMANPQGGLIWAGKEADFFYGTVLEISSGPDVQGGLVPAATAALFIAWMITAFCIIQGPKTMSYVVYVTMPLPILCLIVLLGRSATLPGAEVGIAFYLNGTPSNPNPLANPRICTRATWVDAMGQIFFSLSLAAGTMPAYGSYVPRELSIFRNGIIIAISNSVVSFVAGFVVFGTLGHMAHVQGISMDDLLGSAGGPGLAFVAFPAALATLPEVPQFFAVVFFIMLFTLGLDSAFSIVEAPAAIIRDHLPKGVRPEWVSPSVCLLFFLLGLPFVARGGLYYLDIMDHYVSRSLLLAGFGEGLVYSWLYKFDLERSFKQQLKELAEESGTLLGVRSSWIAWMWTIGVKFVVMPLLIIMIVMTIVDESAANYGGYPTNWLFLGGAFYLFSVVLIFGLGCVPYTPKVTTDGSVKGENLTPA